ncbi:MAG TPA: hypothetical protein VNM87_14140, partial [Candidatus Udaeobacter sp.]|nr:hypothetical protein [Candidatus Udaeobacter sp.]
MLAGLVVICGLALLAGCDRPRARGSFLSRPAIGADGRVAFTGGGRVWIADAVPPGRARRATALPLDWPADRPHWLGREPGLAMSVWFEPWQADLAVWTGTALERLTTTPEDELLDDV